MASRLDLRVATIVLKAKARLTGVVPLSVQLCPPGREDVAWERMAEAHLIAVAKAKHEGVKAPSLLRPFDENERGDSMSDLKTLSTTLHERDYVD